MGFELPWDKVRRLRLERDSALAANASLEQDLSDARAALGLEIQRLRADIESLKATGSTTAEVAEKERLLRNAMIVYSEP